MRTDLIKVAELLREAHRVLFITGAGVSAESGIPTFRGRTGFFQQGLTEDGIPFEEALSATSFRKCPQTSWRYFVQLERNLRGKTPNFAHRVIADLEVPGRRVCVATQNIDGLHQLAGSKHVIELHGNLFRLCCSGCDYRSSEVTFDSLPDLPLCPECGDVLRPDIVLYEESLPAHALNQFLAEQAQGFDLLFSVGTTSLFQYVVEPVLLAVRRHVPTIEINPEETPISDVVSFRLRGKAGPILVELATALCERELALLVPVRR
jgi:NAD-dependent deacetylase